MKWLRVKVLERNFAFIREYFVWLIDKSCEIKI